jgi:predicted nucleic acid-binding protein
VYDRRRLKAELGKGESEALIRRGKSRRCISSEMTGAIAERMGRTAVGTLRLLARLHLVGLAPELHGLVQVLRKDLEFRVSDEIVQQAIDLGAEPI